jgi:hypothetical protein
MFDTLDDVSWMLPFSSKKQPQIIWQEIQVTDEEWQNRRDLITAEHRLHPKKTSCAALEIVDSSGCIKARRAAAARAKAAAAEILE